MRFWDFVHYKMVEGVLLERSQWALFFYAIEDIPKAEMSFFVPRKRKWEIHFMKTLVIVLILYTVIFVALVVAALLTRNDILLASIPLMAKELAHVFRCVCVRLLKKKRTRWPYAVFSPHW